MSRQFLTSTSVLGIVTAAALLAPVPAASQSASSPAKTTVGAGTWTTPRTADGQPDLQGVWDYRTITPMQRPPALASKVFFTDEEAATFEREENRRLNRDLIDPKVGSVNIPAGGIVPYNEFWFDRGNRVVKTKRTSLIIDPPDGRLPSFTPEGNQRMERREEVRRNTRLGHPIADSWEDRPLQERCLLGLNAGPPMFPGAYNNNVQIFQNRDYVMLLIEMVHDVRVVPLDGRPHGHIPQWKGDSRGHWEGDTLVVDTLNFQARHDAPRLHCQHAPDRTVHPHRPRYARLRIHGGRPDNLDETLDRTSSDVEDQRPDLRIRLSRGELRLARRPRRRPRRREGGRRSREEGVEVSARHYGEASR